MENDSNVVYNNDTTVNLPQDYIIRVRGGNYNDTDINKRPTDPIGLSRSLLKMLLQNPEKVVKLQYVGKVAESIAHKAFRLASVEFDKAQHGLVLVNRESNYIATIGGRPAEGLCLRIFPIQVRYAL